MNSENNKLAQLSNVKGEHLDKVLTELYNLLKTTGNAIDRNYVNDPHYVKAGDITKMNEEQKEIFYGIVNDCYKGLITMSDVEDIGGDNYRIKMSDSDNNKIINMTFTCLGLIENIIFTIFFYIYKLQNSSVRISSLVNDSQQKTFAKLYTLILNIPNMAKRINDLATYINSKGENIPLETYDPQFEQQIKRVIPPPQDLNKNGGVKRKTYRKRSRNSYRKRSRNSYRKRSRNSYRKRSRNSYRKK